MYDLRVYVDMGIGFKSPCFLKLTFKSSLEIDGQNRILFNTCAGSWLMQQNIFLFDQPFFYWGYISFSRVLFTIFGSMPEFKPTTLPPLPVVGYHRATDSSLFLVCWGWFRYRKPRYCQFPFCTLAEPAWQTILQTPPHPPSPPTPWAEDYRWGGGC